MSKKKKKQRPRSAHPKPQGQDNAVYVSTYEITSEPILERRYRQLPQDVKDAFDELYNLSQRRPQKAIPELLQWIEKYPNIPQLYNYLSIAYSRLGQNDKAEEAIQENLRHNPDYLFARLNYAEMLLQKGDYEGVARIFDNKFDLKMLYPKRKRFHISEVTGFMGIVGVYFARIGEREPAQKYYEILQEIAPRHPATKLLRQELHPGCLHRLLLRLAEPPPLDESQTSPDQEQDEV